MDTVDWRQARQWLIDTGVIPPTHKVTKPNVTLLDFARSLRDGAFLCSLLNRLRPGSVEYTARPMMQHLYLHNINAFLGACKKFGIKDDDLFVDLELYDVDNFSKVMLTLSKLSYTQDALSRGWKPFPSDENRDYYNNGEDIYAPLHDVSNQTAVYANVNDLYQDPFTEADSFGYGDEKIYDTVLRYRAKPMTEANTVDELKLGRLKELFETEKSFAEVLHVIAKDYYDVLKDHCNDDLRRLFFAAQKLLPFHEKLRDNLEKCANPKPNIPGNDVATCFFDLEQGLLEYGMYAAVLPEATEKAKMLQNQRDVSRLMQATMERSQSRFPLSDILPVPIQRIMRYPLLIKELEKSVKKSSVQSQIVQIEKLVVFLEDIAKYINIAKGDYETLKTIGELESNLVEYKGPKLIQCGRYIMDGELRISSSRDREELKSRWVFLFDKILLITNRRQRFRAVSYVVKSHHFMADVTVETASTAKNRPHAFRIKVEGGKNGEPKEYIATAKTDQLKLLWTESLKKSREIIAPRAGKRNHHNFEYLSFESAQKCGSCNKLLHGFYFQGYKCSGCGVVSHRECLSHHTTCMAAKHPSLPQMPHQQHPSLIAQASVDTGLKQLNRTVRDRGGGINGTEPTKRTYVATQKFIAFGHRRDIYLTFEQGDEIDIINTSDPEKWEGIHCRTGNRGFVSSHYLIRKPQILPTVSTSSNMSPDPNPSPRVRRMPDYPWYIGRKTRIDAEIALHRQKDGVFLIRESMDRPGEYAIALRWNNMPKHIKIMKNNERFYVSDACDFNSIPELVEFYHKNSLGQSFPGVDTTLKYPYRDVIDGRGNVDLDHQQTRHNSRHNSVTNMPPPSFPAPQPHSHIPPPTISPPSTHSMGGSWSNDGNNVYCEALYDFNGDGPGQLSFSKHDVVKIINKDTKRLGWWFGECNGNTGIFRADHVYTRDSVR